MDTSKGPNISGFLPPPPLTWGVSDSLDTLPPTCINTANLLFLSQTVDVYLRKFSRKASRFASRLSRSLTVSRRDSDRSVTWDLLLVFHSNYRSISCCLRAERRYLSHFPTSVYLAPRWGGSPWNFVTRSDKLEWRP